MEKKIISEI